jgi:hypothetical protein
VQAFAVVGQSHQVPFAGDLALTAQGKSRETKNRLDDAEDRLDGLLAGKSTATWQWALSRGLRVGA